MFVSATPSEYELDMSSVVAKQIIRPTGLLDPVIEIKSSDNQVEDIHDEIKKITVKDEDLRQQYVAGVQESLAPFDAEVVFRGKLDKILAGQNDKDLVVLIEFSDPATLARWCNSEKYRSLIPLRDEAAHVVITTYKTSAVPVPARSVHI